MLGTDPLCPCVAANSTAAYRFFEIASEISFYFTPVLVTLGTLGNVLSVLVFFRSNLRYQSTAMYLTALAISDTVFLVQLIVPWLNAMNVSGIFHMDGFCQGFIYLSYVCSFLSSWMVLAFTAERFVAVVYPLRRNVICTTGRARYVVYYLVAVALALNLPVLKFAHPYNEDCILKVEYLTMAARFNVLDTVVTFTVPLVGIVVLNGWILVGVYRMSCSPDRMLKGDGSQLPQLIAYPRWQQRVTKMLLLVSTVFVVFNLPAYAVRIHAYRYNKFSATIDATIETSNNSTINDEAANLMKSALDKTDQYLWMALQEIARIFFNSTFGMNFMLYCVSGRNFRENVIKAWPWLQRVMQERRRRKQAPIRRPAPAVQRASHAPRSSPAATNARAAATNARAAATHASRFAKSIIGHGPATEWGTGATRKHPNIHHCADPDTMTQCKYVNGKRVLVKRCSSPDVENGLYTGTTPKRTRPGYVNAPEVFIVHEDRPGRASSPKTDRVECTTRF